MADQLNVVKIFVGGLPASCDNDKLNECFSKFGSIKEAVVMMDSSTGRHRGFGYVTYHESAGVEAAMASYSENRIDNKWIEVKRCIPQEHMKGQKSGGGRGSGNRSAPAQAPQGMAAQTPGAYDAAAAAQYGQYGAGNPQYFQQYPGYAGAYSNVYGSAYGDCGAGQYGAYPGYAAGGCYGGYGCGAAQGMQAAAAYGAQPQAYAGAAAYGGGAGLEAPYAAQQQQQLAAAQQQQAVGAFRQAASY